MLENLDLGAGITEQIEEQRQEVLARVTGDLEPVVAAEAFGRATSLLDRLVGSRCPVRLAELAPHVAARELEVFLEPSDDDGSSVISGAVDLVYTDPDDGRLVVADYKTDRVETEEAIEERVERYRPQLAVYASALEQALNLEEPAHTELWFLGADRIVRTN